MITADVIRLTCIVTVLSDAVKEELKQVSVIFLHPEKTDNDRKRTIEYLQSSHDALNGHLDTSVATRHNI